MTTIDHMYCVPALRSAMDRRRGSIAAMLLMGGLTAGFSAAKAEESEFPGADQPGPVLTTHDGNPSVAAYNKAVSLFLEKKYDEALEKMRAAIRADSFGYPTVGLAYSNLCLMYLKVGKYKNARAACSKALIVLPAYIPATINLGRAKERIGPTPE